MTSVTPWGDPDLQGVWASDSATPLERPGALAGREFLTDEEVALLGQRAAEIFNGETDAAFGDSVYETVLNEAETFVATSCDRQLQSILADRPLVRQPNVADRGSAGWQKSLP